MKHKDRFVFGRTARSVLRTMLSVVLLLCSILFLPGVTADVSAQPLTADTTSKIVTSTAKVTISNVPEGKSITWPTYQVLYATYDAGSNALEYHLTDWARAVLVGTGTTEEAAIKNITKLTKTGTGEKEQSDLVNQLAAAATKTPYSASWTVTGTTAAAADLPVGAYLVIPSCEEMTFLNMLVSVDTSGTTDTDENGWVLTAKGAVLKGKSLSIDKKITGKNGVTVEFENGKTTETAQIGDTIHYTIVAQVPHYPDNSTNKTFKVVDTPTNLSISTDSISVAGVDTENAETEIPKASYAVSKDSVNGPVTIDFSSIYNGTFYNAATKSWPYVSVKITYTAVVTEDAEMGTNGNPNTAKLIYWFNTQEKELPSPKTTVFTYGLNVVKLEAGTEAKKLTNAVFQISRDESQTPLYFKDNEDGSYTLAQDQTTAASTTGYTKDLTTQGTDGSFWLKGLDAGVDYSLKEVKAPSGYSVNTDTLTIRLTAETNPDDSTYTGILRDVTGTEKDKNGQAITGAGSWTYGVLDGDKAKAAVSLTDTKLFELPATGGKGTDGFARNGILLLTAAALVYGISRRKTQDERG